MRYSKNSVLSQNLCSTGLFQSQFRGVYRQQLSNVYHSKQAGAHPYFGYVSDNDARLIAQQ
jgi:hypothetical protein